MQSQDKIFPPPFFFDVVLLRYKKATKWTEVNLARNTGRGVQCFWSFWNRWVHSVRQKREIWAMERDGEGAGGRLQLWLWRCGVFTRPRTLRRLKNRCSNYHAGFLFPLVWLAAGGSASPRWCFSWCDFRRVEVNFKAKLLLLSSTLAPWCLWACVCVLAWHENKSVVP